MEPAFFMLRPVWRARAVITAKSTIDREVKTAWKGKTLILAESCDFISLLEKTILRFVYTHIKGMRLEDCDLMGAARGRYNDLEI